MSSETIVQRNPDGSTVTIPKQMYSSLVEVGDKPARLLATIGLVLASAGAGVGGYAAYVALSDERTPMTERVSPDVGAALKDMQEQIDKNTMFDCLNENVIRQTYGFPPADFGECKQERDRFGDKNLEEFRLAPTPTPKPTTGRSG